MSGTSLDHLSDDVVRSFDPDTLELILLPTEKCDFRCTYCYETFEHGRMRPELVGGIKRLLTVREPGLRDLHLNWFGGEPLVASDIVLDLSSYARQLYGPRFRSSMSTNGYQLTEDLGARLVRAGVTDYQISLDGPLATHDRTRRRANGRGTFDVIWTNLMSLRRLEEPFNVSLRVHYTRDTAEEVLRLVDDLATTFDGDGRFGVFLKEIGKYGGDGDHLIVAMDHGPRRDFIARAEVACSGRIRLSHEHDAVSEGFVCYAARLNSFLVRSDGRLGKCTVALNDDRNVVGRLRSDGTMDLDRAALAAWTKGLFSGDAAELGCPLSQFSALTAA